MQLKELKDKIEYNNFIAASPSGSFLQSWEWGQWQEKLGRKIKRLAIYDNSGLLLGAGLFIYMPLPFGRYYIYSPYGPVFDETSPMLVSDLMREFSGAVFIRIEAKNYEKHPVDIKTKNIQPGKTLVLDLTQTEDKLLAEMHQKTRYNIRLAQKHGVEIQDEFALTIGKGLFVQEAVELIKHTSKRQGYIAQSKNYFEDLINFFVLKNNISEQSFEAMPALSSFSEGGAKEDAINNQQADLKLHIYKALYNKQLVTSAIMIDFGKTRTYLFGGSAEENKNVMAPYLLHWQAVLDAKKLGILEYDFWGIETASGETPGFVRFKLGFGGIEKQYAGAYDIITKKTSYNIYKLSRKINKFKQKISPH